MRFASLGSGSSGNATVIQTKAVGSKTTILLDCGFSLKETKRRLARLKLYLEEIDAIVVSHEHTDHINGVLNVAKSINKPIYTSWGTAAASNILNENIICHFLESGVYFSIGNLQIEPFTVPHDAREPLQFIFKNGVKRLGVLTDTGIPTKIIINKLKTCHSLILECNYDKNMLIKGNYALKLKERIAGDFGHLSNDSAIEILNQVKHSNLQYVVAAHLSKENNSKEIVQSLLSKALNDQPENILIADQELGINWLEIN